MNKKKLIKKMTIVLGYMGFNEATNDELITIVRAIELFNKYLPMDSNKKNTKNIQGLSSDVITIDDFDSSSIIKPISIKRVVRYNNNILTKPEFVFRSHSEAEKLIYGLQELLCCYGFVSVADLYDIIGCESSFTDNKIGWYNLDAVSLKPIYGGWNMTLPKPVEEK